MASRRTRLVVSILGVLALGGAAAGFVLKRNHDRVPVQVGKVTRRDLTSIVSASGEVKPKRYVNVSANVSGRITHLYVKEGDKVRQGQVLARIDSTRFAADTRQSEAAVKAARADLVRAQADLEAARLAYERTRQMHEDRLVADQSFDQARADYDMRKANADSLRQRIAQVEAALESSADNLEKTTVPSPMDGVVTSLLKEEGEVVIGAQSFQPSVMMTVADLSVMEAEVLVDETDIRNVALGQEARVRVDALDRVEIKGQVTEIGASAIPRGVTSSAQTTTSSSNTGNQAKDFKVTITLQDPPDSLRPGLNATADVTTARKTGVLAVPIQAVVVRQVDEQGRPIDPEQDKDKAGPRKAVRRRGEEKDGVFLVKDGQAVFRPVVTGILGETEIEIREGVQEGELIVTGSYKTLRTLKHEAKVKIEEGDGRQRT
jgi:HlyD family secretion protein